jgi:hypothetical protein
MFFMAVPPDAGFGIDEDVISVVFPFGQIQA